MSNTFVQSFLSLLLNGLVKVMGLVLTFADFIIGYHPVNGDGQFLVSQYLQAFQQCQAPFSLLMLITTGAQGVLFPLAGLILTIFGTIGFMLSVTRVPRQMLASAVDTLTGVFGNMFGGQGSPGAGPMAGGMSSADDIVNLNATSAVLTIFVGIFFLAIGASGGDLAVTLTNLVAQIISSVVMVPASMLASAIYVVLQTFASLAGVQLVPFCSPSSAVLFITALI